MGAGGGPLGVGLGEVLDEVLAFFVRTREAESRRYEVPEFDNTTSMRRPVCPALETGRPTLTLIHPESELNEMVAVSVVPPRAVSLSNPLTPEVEPGSTQMVTVSVSPAVTAVVTLWLSVWPPGTTRAYWPPRAFAFGPSSEAFDAVHPDVLPSNDGDARGMSVPAGAEGSLG